MSIIMNGSAIVQAKEVEENIIFKPGSNKNTRKHSDPDNPGALLPWHGLGIHWTGGERGAAGVSATLEARELSIHFVLEPSGQLVQMADLATKCAHIGSPGNDRFVGLETSCRGFATKEDWAEAAKVDPTLREREDIDWETPRDTYTDKIGGHKANFAGFNREQIVSIIWLADTLAQVCHFPRTIPARVITDKELEATNWPLPNIQDFIVELEGQLWLPDFSRDPNKKGRAATHRGALGHFHVHETKMDPGTQPLYALWAVGWNPTGKRLKGAVPFCGK